MALSDRRRTGTLNAGRPVPPRDPQRGDRAGRAGRELLSHSGATPASAGARESRRPREAARGAPSAPRTRARQRSAAHARQRVAKAALLAPKQQPRFLPLLSGRWNRARCSHAVHRQTRLLALESAAVLARASRTLAERPAQSGPQWLDGRGEQRWPARGRPGPALALARKPPAAHRPFRGFPFSFTLLFALAAVFHNLWMAFIRPSVRSCRCHGEGWRVALIWSLLPGRGSASLVPEFSPLTRLRRRAGDSPLGPVRALPP